MLLATNLNRTTDRVATGAGTACRMKNTRLRNKQTGAGKTIALALFSLILLITGSSDHPPIGIDKNRTASSGMTKSAFASSISVPDRSTKKQTNCLDNNEGGVVDHNCAGVGAIADRATSSFFSPTILRCSGLPKVKQLRHGNSPKCGRLSDGLNRKSSMTNAIWLI